MNSFLQDYKIVFVSMFISVLAIGIFMSPSAKAQSACVTCNIDAQDLRDDCDLENTNCVGAVALNTALGSVGCGLLIFYGGLTGAVCTAFLARGAALAVVACGNILRGCQLNASVYLRDCLGGCGGTPNLQRR